MANHHLEPAPDGAAGSPVEREPAAIADTVKAVAALAAVLGWSFDDAVVGTVTSVLSGLVFLYAAFWGRGKVTSPATLTQKYVRMESGRLDTDGDA